MLDTEQLAGINRLKASLKREPGTLEDVWLAQPVLWQELGWSQSQLRLWLLCQPGLEAIKTDGQLRYQFAAGDKSERPDLGEIIAKIVQGVGKPMPLAQLKSKLPAGTVVTEPMLKAAINQHPQLTLMGPMVKLN
ncbi:MAG: hypothetical protein DRR42_01585 [Gammaproteobacteria bacterium]|nr:MAG: hypothetical protein DRR42_01585 [Gammaproteobacteria bacterium]